MKKNFLLIMAIGFISFAGISGLEAKTYLLCTVSSQAEKDNTTHFILTTEGPNDDIKTFTQKKFETKKPGNVLIHQVFNLANYKLNSNLVLETKSGHIVAQMRSSNFAPHNGGNLKIDFLYNGITGKRGSASLELVRGGSGWQLVDRNNKVVKSMYLVSHKIAFTTVGVEEIEFNRR